LTEEFARRQDHVIYGASIVLLIVALTIGIDYQLGGTRYALQLQMLQQAGGFGSEWTAVLVACAAYLVFRLVRPFPFTQPEGHAPAGALYWLGNFIVTLAGAASATFLAWAVLKPGVLAQYRSAGLALSLAIVAGFMLIEGSIARKSTASATRAVYADAGLFSALLVLPACLAWYVSASPRSGLARLLGPLFADAASLGAPLTLAGGVFALWWISMPLRRRLRQRPLYRGAMQALWVFGLAAYAVQAVIARSGSRTAAAAPDRFEELWGFTYSNPGFALSVLIVLWALCAAVLYLAQRRWRPA
jgi:hypothetical protein